MGNELDPRVLQIVLEKLPEYGLKLVSQPSATSLHVSSPSHKSAMINLENVAELCRDRGRRGPGGFRVSGGRCPESRGERQHGARQLGRGPRAHLLRHASV